MLKYILLLIIFLMAGCAGHAHVSVKSMPTNYCAKGETENCRPWTASEIAGPGSRGHIEDIKETP